MIELFKDDFTGTTAMQQFAGNGSINFPGTVAQLVAPNSQNCDWWYNIGPYCPIVHTPAGLDLRPEKYVLPLRFETRLSAYTRTTTATLAGLSLFTGLAAPRYTVHVGWYPGDGKVYAQYALNTFGGTWTSVALVDPATTPHTYCIYWNRGLRPTAIPETGEILNAGEIKFLYSINDGVTWTTLYTWTSPVYSTFLNVGVFNKKWDAGATANSTAEFDYFSASIFEEDNLHVVDPNVAAAFEDQIEFLPLTDGAPKHASPYVASIKSRTVGPTPMEEEIVFPPTDGPPDQGALALQHGKVLLPASAGFDEDITIEIGDLPEFNNTTSDADGNFHFVSSTPMHAYRAFFYNTAGERWTNPTSYNFTGYARNGKHYTNGVEDAGPVWAPWASEVFGVDRGNRDDFPVKALIVVAKQELCIFDLDTFNGSVSSLKLWMRFRYGNSSNFYMIGRGDSTIRDIKMSNGLLIIGQKHTGWENGRLILIDFKGDDTYNTGNLIGSDGHWRWNGTIAQRHTALFTTSGVSPSLRQNNEYVYNIAPFVDADGVTWVGLGGEDDHAIVRIPTTGRPAEVTNITGPDVGESTGSEGDEDYRYIFFDRLGLLWFVIGTRLFRNFTYSEGVFVADTSRDREETGIYKSVEFPGTIKGLAEAQNFIFVAVDGYGIYAVHRGTMEKILAYTPVGGGGEGTRRIASIGEVFADAGYPIRKGLVSLSLALSNFLAISTDLPRDGAAECTIIRTTDDYAPVKFQFPDIVEPRAYWHVIIL